MNANTATVTAVAREVIHAITRVLFESVSLTVSAALIVIGGAMLCAQAGLFGPGGSATLTPLTALLCIPVDQWAAGLEALNLLTPVSLGLIIAGLMGVFHAPLLLGASAVVAGLWFMLGTISADGPSLQAALSDSVKRHLDLPGGGAIIMYLPWFAVYVGLVRTALELGRLLPITVGRLTPSFRMLEQWSNSGWLELAFGVIIIGLLLITLSLKNGLGREDYLVTACMAALVWVHVRTQVRTAFVRSVMSRHPPPPIP